MISSEIYQIGPISYDSSTRVLTHENGYTEYFTPRVNDVFLLLLEHQGQCVEKDLLLSKCWGDVIVSEQALTNVISKLRKMLYKNCPGILTITTVSKSGYLLELHDELQVLINDTNCLVVNEKQNIINDNTIVLSGDTQRKIFFKKWKITIVLIAVIAILLGLIIYQDRLTNKLPYFVNKSSYTESIKIRNNVVYIQRLDNTDLDNGKIVKELEKGIASICNADVYVRFYNNSRVENNVGLVVFIITRNGRAFNFRMSKYINSDLGLQLNHYLQGKKITC